MDDWLRNGGLVVAASDRAARVLVSAYHRARRAEGLTAWPMPNVQDWKSFARNAWEERTADARLLLNPAQEQALWAGIIAEDRHLLTVLENPRHRLADLAMDAHNLLCSYAHRFLHASARAFWQQDAGAFSHWLAAFDETCRAGDLLSGNRLPLELIPILEADHSERPPLLLAGFDRLVPLQRALFDTWGVWHEAALADPAPAEAVRFYAADDAQAELDACARWCGLQFAADPHARLLVVTQDVNQRRGEIERAFLKHTAALSSGHLSLSPSSSGLFEFSLGVPLSQIPLARGASLLLRWLTGSLQEHELDWLLSTGQAAASAQEASALQAYMRTLRRRGLERTHWSLSAFLSQPPAANSLPAEWSRRMNEAQHRIASESRLQSPLEWGSLVPQLLQTVAWPGYRTPSSAEFQAARRWQQAVDTCGSLGFDGRRISWKDFLSTLARTLDETLFAPESHDAPIQIAGPAESAGLTADAVWFLGADENAWPASGAIHPLLPLDVQRDAGMPHASPQLDWDLAHSITTRLLASAPQPQAQTQFHIHSKIHFSYARQNEGVETGPSRLAAQLAGSPQPLPSELAPPPPLQPLTVAIEDASRIPFPAGKVEGGSSVLTAQSQCPFKAFATARLGAQRWEPAEAGLSAAQRGQLLHAVLHAVWAGPPNGIRTHEDLLGLPDRRAFVAGHVHRVLHDKIPAGLRERMPRRYLELEEPRLVGLIAEWLDYEAARHPFTVAGTEVPGSISLAGLTLSLRLDRIDRLNDGSLLVVDYKTGQVSPKSWDLPRPDDVQLPLYAGFALGEEMLGGLVFAKLRAGDQAFAGRVGDAKATLLPTLPANSTLVRESLTIEQLIDWRGHIEQLAADFVAGRAEVDPREYPKTCERCGLQSLCRIQEHPGVLAVEDDTDTAEAAND